MNPINRSVAVVLPKKPFLEWARLGDDEGMAGSVLESMHEDPSAFLLPEFLDDDEREAMIEHFSATIFERMLDGWLRDSSGWPKNRDYKMFKEWFEVRVCSVVDDLFSGQPLVHED